MNIYFHIVDPNNRSYSLCIRLLLRYSSFLNIHRYICFHRLHPNNRSYSLCIRLLIGCNQHTLLNIFDHIIYRNILVNICNTLHLLLRSLLFRNHNQHHMSARINFYPIYQVCIR